MESRTGMEELARVLRRLCLEHRAMQLLLAECPEISASDVPRNAASAGLNDDARIRIDGVLETLKSGTLDDASALLVATALRSYLVA